MKYFNILFLAACFTLAATAAMAQDANFMNYQAVAHNAAGEVMANEDISLRISIVKGSPEGTASFVETHYATTNQFGLFNLQIGRGSAEKGSFESMEWNADRFFLKIEMDINGWQTLGISELATVPYAMAATWATEAAHAKTADHALIADSVRNMSGKGVGGFYIDRDTRGNIIGMTTAPDGDIWISNDENSVLYRINNTWYELNGNAADCPAVVAEAGTDITTSVVAINLNASAAASNAVGTWTQIAGNSSTFANNTLANTAVTLNANLTNQETFIFRWTVENDCGNTDYDDITVTYVPNACRGIAQIGHQGDATPMYDVVALGNQCWMQQSVTKVVSGGSQFSNGYRYYNWSAAQTVCANGWHLPTQSEVTTLYNWYINSGGGRVNFYNDPDGFSPDMAGIKNIHYNPGFEHYGLGSSDRYWTSSIYSSTEAYLLHGNGTRMQLGDHWYNGNDYGTPVRCIKDDN